MKPVGYLINTREGLQGEAGVFYNYILAENGLFIRARNAYLDANMCIAPEEVRGLAPLGESVELLHGKIPKYLLDLGISTLWFNCNVEQYLAITWQDRYILDKPFQSQTECSVQYETLPNTVMDIHSHMGGAPPHFSGTDDRDEQGFCLYAVVSGLHDLFPTVVIRIGIYGYFFPLTKEEVFV